jgi:uncharacterized membrane protein YkoI
MTRRALLAVALLTVAAPAAAETHDRAREALRAGEIRPLAEILAAATRDFAGEVVEVELERERDLWVYELKLLTPQGSVLKLEYDARAATLLRARGRDADAARRR